MTRTTVLFAAAALALTATSCKKPADEGAGSTGSAAAPTGGGRAGGGIEDTTNDQAVVALAREAIKCGWSEGWGLKSGCPALEAWSKADALKGGKADATFLNFLGDAQREVRWLGASGLNIGGQTYRTDATMAKRLLASGKAEKEGSVASKLGDAIGRINLDASGMSEAIKATLGDASASSQLRSGILGGVLFTNRAAPGVYDLVIRLARTDKDKAVRKAAAASLWTGGSDRHDDTCKLWLELTDDADDDLAGHSAYHASWWSAGGGCTGQWDALLTGIEKRARAGKVRSSMMTSALGWLQKQGKASDAQKKRALAAAKLVVETATNDKMARGDALRIVGEHDPDARKYAARFESDPEFFVKSAAARIAKEGKK